jgi:hypothetical protein
VLATIAAGAGASSPEPVAEPASDPQGGGEPAPVGESLAERSTRSFHHHAHGDPAASGSQEPSHPLHSLHRAIAGLAAETAFETAAESVQWFDDGWQGPFAGEGVDAR